MMTEQREKILIQLRRRVLVEAGHRCAIPTCREMSTVDIHHIVPWKEGKEHKYENLIALCPNCHRMADNEKIDRKSLRMYKNNLRFLYDKYTIFEIDVLFDLNKLPDDKAMQFPSYLILLIKRLIETGLIEWIQTPQGVTIGGMKANPDYIKITSKGQEYIKQINTEDVGY
ncbi:MAG: HNH endonuclease [Nanoarchaeota archaeon]|nr:HNH endonuclease [Nanoarchaeota archaeon]